MSLTINDLMADVAVVYERSRDQGSMGAGRLIAPGLVLTAGHVLADSSGEATSRLEWQVVLLRSQKSDGSWSAPSYQASVVWCGLPGLDLALLQLKKSQSPFEPDNVAPCLKPTFARYELADEITNVGAVGFPEIVRPPSGPLREYHVRGTLRIASREDPFVWSIKTANKPDKPKMWRGMSGAAAFTEGRNNRFFIFGVVQDVPAGFSDGQLAVARLDRAFQDARFCEILTGALGTKPALIEYTRLEERELLAAKQPLYIQLAVRPSEPSDQAELPGYAFRSINLVVASMDPDRDLHGFFHAIDKPVSGSTVSLLGDPVAAASRAAASDNDGYALQLTRDKNRMKRVWATALYDGVNKIDLQDAAIIEQDVLKVLSMIAVSEEKDDSDTRGFSVEVEMIVGSAEDNADVSWLAQDERPDLFTGFIFENFTSLAADDSTLQAFLRLPRSSEGGEFPPSVEHFIANCKQSEAGVDRWVRFDTPNFWFFRGLRLTRSTSRQDLTEFRAALERALGSVGLNPAEASLRVVATQRLGRWLTPLKKLRKGVLTVNELSEWERKIAPDSQLFIATGNFLGDQDKSIYEAMLTNFVKNVRYSYFLRSPTDLVRWKQFYLYLSSQVEKRMIGLQYGMMNAYLLEFSDDSFWKEVLNCWIAVHNDRPVSGYRMVSDLRNGKILYGIPMERPQLLNTYKLLRASVINNEVMVSTSRYVSDSDTEGVLIWIDYGIFGTQSMSFSEREAFVRRFDEEASFHVSRVGGQVIRSNEMGFVIFVRRSQGDFRALEKTISRSYGLIDDLSSLIAKIFRETLPDHFSGEHSNSVHRIVAEYGSLTRVMRASGRTIAGEILSQCRSEATNLQGGGTGQLKTLRQIALQVQVAPPSYMVDL